MTAVQSTPDARPRLLLVDDEPKNLRLLADIFSSEYRLSMATSGAQALAVLDVTPDVELILLDLMMPGMDGQQVHERLQSRPALRQIPVIFITARDDPESEIAALNSGVADYLHKPVHVGLARARVRQQIALSRQRIELRAAREAADAGSRAKSQFLTGVSHELRTPLNAILGFSQVMQLDGTLSAEHRSGLAEIHEAGQHLLALINDVLDLGKIEASKVELLTEPLEPRALVESCLRLVEPLAARQQLRLEVQASGDDTTRVLGDAVRVRQVVVNLLSNAIKFSHPGGRVIVRLGAAALCGGEGRDRPGDGLIFEVADEGLGIEPEFRSRLFEPFRRSSAADRIEGTGIGLTICRRLVEMMGGGIDFHSELGVGTRFWFTLPVAAQAQGAAAASTPPRVAAGGGSSPIEREGSDRGLPPQPTAPLSRPATVLCIDDNAPNLKLLEIVLRRVPGLSVVATQDPRQALTLAARHRPDLVIVDIQMPDIDGFEVLRRLRAVPALASTPIVALSANAMPDDILHGQRAGFSDYLTKPFDVARLLGTVRRLVTA